MCASVANEVSWSHAQFNGSLHAHIGFLGFYDDSQNRKIRGEFVYKRGQEFKHNPHPVQLPARLFLRHLFLIPCFS